MEIKAGEVTKGMTLRYAGKSRVVTEVITCAEGVYITLSFVGQGFWLADAVLTKMKVRTVVLVDEETVTSARALGFTAQVMHNARPRADGLLVDEDVEFVKGDWCVHLTARGWRMVNRADPSRLYIRTTDYRKTALEAMEALS